MWRIHLIQLRSYLWQVTCWTICNHWNSVSRCLELAHRCVDYQLIPSQFMDRVFNVLDQVDVGMRPLTYLLSGFPQRWKSRGAIVDGFYTEFGVFRGASLGEAVRQLKHGNVTFNGTIAGFDSFQGLPARWRERFIAGTFAGEHLYNEVRASLPEVELYKGWFQNTIAGFLERHPRVPAALIHHDNDIFVSTSITFSMLTNRIVPGTFLVFDELTSYKGFETHEILAFYIWLVDTKATVCELLTWENLMKRASRQQQETTLLSIKAQHSR